MLDNTLFKPDKGKKETRFGIASVEAVKLKKMIGALRALWRSTKTNGKDDKLTALKQLLQPSPGRVDNSSDRADGEAPEASPGGELVEEPGEDEVKSDDEGAGSHAEDDGEATPNSAEPLQDGEGSPADSLEASQQSAAPLEDAEMSPKPAHGDVSDAESNGSNSLSATTLRMGETTPQEEQDEEEEQRDSQVSSGWLGKAYVQFNKQEKEIEELQKLRASRAKAFDELHERLAKDLDVEVAEGYVKWCKKCIDQYGDYVYEHLCEVKTYWHWLDALQKDTNAIIMPKRSD